MADTVDLRDPYTGGHSRRVTEFVESILKEMGKQGPEVELITTAARLHDIGKIAVPDTILNKPGKLTDEEWAIMASHPEVGADFLGKHPGFKRGVEIVRHHHEAWDGTGYPHKLKATEIPLGARIIAVADSYDAMTSDRPYRKGMNTDEAVRILREGRGTQWDAQIVDAFVRSIASELQPQAPVLRLVRSDGSLQASA
jgi:putative two-component system response regulator